MDAIVRKCKTAFKKYYVGYHKLKPLSAEICMFVDDVVLIADSSSKLEDNIRSHNEAAKRYGLQMNLDITPVIRITTD